MEKRKAYKTIEQQLAADKRYYKKNKEKRQYLNDRNATRRFIKIKATEEDLEEVQNLLNERKKYKK